MSSSRSNTDTISIYDEKTQAILRSAQEGERAALEALFERVGPALLSWVHLRMSAAFRQRVDPRDAVQEVWLRAMQRIAALDPRTTPFRAWIFRIAHFVLIEMSRNLVRTRGSASQDGSSFLASRPDSETGVSVRFAREDAVQVFLDRVGGLKREHRELVVLRGLEGCSFDEIAKRLGGNAPTWEKRWKRLRTRIGSEVAPDYLL